MRYSLVQLYLVLSFVAELSSSILIKNVKSQLKLRTALKAYRLPTSCRNTQHVRSTSFFILFYILFLMLKKRSYSLVQLDLVLSFVGEFSLSLLTPSLLQPVKFPGCKMHGCVRKQHIFRSNNIYFQCDVFR